MRAALTATTVAALLLPAGCDGADQDLPRVGTLVTLGDSFTSAAGVPTVEGTDGCQRSDHDYGALAARKLKATYVDVSCGSATTREATAPQTTTVATVPPQLDGVTRDADVVTVSLGLNDTLFFRDMVLTCPAIAATQPTGTPCQDANAASGQPGPADQLVQVARNIRAVLHGAKRRAPDARILLVGYPQPVPASGTCPELPLPTGEYSYFHDAFEQLADTMSEVADNAGVTFVDVLGPSQGHDICAGKDAWVLGSADRPGAGIAYHPLVAEQRAIANLVVDALRDGT